MKSSLKAGLNQNIGTFEYRIFGKLSSSEKIVEFHLAPSRFIPRTWVPSSGGAALSSLFTTSKS